MLSVAEALAAVLHHAKPLPASSVDLATLPLGQVLAESIASDIDSPPYTKSLMDGYAVRSVDCAHLSIVLNIVEEIAAGKMPTLPVPPQGASRIMTGAPIPDGADTVVMIERTEAVSPSQVRITTAVKPWQNILERGKEMKAGEIILQPGSVLGPQEIGLLAAVGRTSVKLYPKPRVTVLPTGDEIVEPGNKPGPGQIRNSNGPMLLAQTMRAGGIPRYVGIGRDTAESLRSLIRDGLAGSDVLILSGGVSAGKFDLVPGVLQELGVVSRFHKVLIKPGKPLFFGTLGEGAKLVFGLPGNPVASFVCFELFIRSALRKMSGHADPGPHQMKLPIADDFAATNDRPTYWPARIENSQDGSRVRPLPWFGSADLRALHTANALLAIPSGEHRYTIDQDVPVILLDA